MLILVNLSDFNFFLKAQIHNGKCDINLWTYFIVCILLYFFKKLLELIIFIQYIMIGVSSYSIPPRYPPHNKLHTFFSNYSLFYINWFATLFIYRAKFLKFSAVNHCISMEINISIILTGIHVSKDGKSYISIFSIEIKD